MSLLAGAPINFYRARAFQFFPTRAFRSGKKSNALEMERSAEEDIRELARILHFALSIKRKEYAGEAKVEDGKFEVTKLHPDTERKELITELLYNLVMLHADKSDIESIHNSYSVKIVETEPGHFVFGARAL